MSSLFSTDADNHFISKKIQTNSMREVNDIARTGFRFTGIAISINVNVSEAIFKENTFTLIEKIAHKNV